jgi:hypothetical protein
MLTPVFPRFHRRAPEAKPTRRAPAPPPVLDNLILAVTHYGPFQLLVTLSNPAASIDFGGEALQAIVGEDHYAASGGDLSDPLHPIFYFDVDVSGALEWVAVNPTAWTFVNAQPLLEPWAGAIS